MNEPYAYNSNRTMSQNGKNAQRGTCKDSERNHGSTAVIATIIVLSVPFGLAIWYAVGQAIVETFSKLF